MTVFRPRVGIVTRTKDRSVLLRRALASVVGQTYRDWIMVIVNDGGDPGGVRFLVDHFAERADGRIRVIDNPVSLGMEGASKVGIESLDTDCFVFHDDDDTWAPEFLSTAVAELYRIRRQFPNTEGVATRTHRVMESVRGNLVQMVSVEAFESWIPVGFLSFDRMLAGNFIPPISFLFTRKAYESAGSIYEIIPYLGDWAFLIRVLSCHDIYLVPQYLAFYHWRVSDGSGGMGNSVTADVDQHHFYRQYLLNAWLREDLTAGRTGVGVYANLRQHVETIVRQTKRDHSPPPPAAPPSDPALPQSIVDYYWESASWQLLRPFRALVNAVLRHPAETKPLVGATGDAWRAALAIQESLSWQVTAPIRWASSLARALARSAGLGPRERKSG
jgi:glycosyltransferase involved in cell wall biosynthesis